MMRLFILLLASLAIWSPVSVARDVTLFGQGDMDTTYNWAVSRDKLDAQPQWSPTMGPPPLSIARAVEIAETWTRKQHPDVSQFAVAAVTLGRAGIWSSSRMERWYYRIEFHPVVGGRPLFGGQFVAVVLFDGSVVEPQAEKRVPAK